MLHGFHSKYALKSCMFIPLFICELISTLLLIHDTTSMRNKYISILVCVYKRTLPEGTLFVLEHWTVGVEFKTSDHKYETKIPEGPAHHIGAIDQIPALSQTCAAFFSCFSLRWLRGGWRQTERGWIDTSIYNMKITCEEKRSGKNKLIIFLLSVPLCKGKSISGCVSQKVNLGNHNHISQ